MNCYKQTIRKLILTSFLALTSKFVMRRVGTRVVIQILNVVVLGQLVRMSQATHQQLLVLA